MHRAAKSAISKSSRHIPPNFKLSSVGAGDAFACGILYGAYSGMDLVDSIHIARAVAAYSLSGQGGSDAIKPLKQLITEMERFQ